MARAARLCSSAPADIAPRRPAPSPRLTAGLGELELEVVVSGLLPREVEVEREGFLR